MSRCIYCPEELLRPVPPEHIIPQGFGTFENNLTLFCVCANCNRFFGSTLEWPMRNSSPEGILRFVHGFGQGQVGGIGTKGIEFKIVESADWRGARVVLKVNRRTRSSHVYPIPQVGARRNPSEEWVWYLEKDLDAEFAAKYPKGSEFRIVGGGNDQKRMLERLKRVCPTYLHKGVLESPIGKDGKIGLNYLHEFNAVVRRCLAKIAFNYLAFVAGEEFAKRPDFDAVRAFIRHGTEPENDLVRVGRRPILATELLTGARVTNGHIIAVEALLDKRQIQARLALFNSLKYRIILAPNYGGLWFARGHHFDIEARKCTELIQSQFVQAVGFR
jgi:hypothetical protein